MTITRSSLTSNHATVRGGGLAQRAGTGNAVAETRITDSLVSNNTAPEGGGVHVAAGTGGAVSTMLIQQSAIIGNEAATDDAGASSSAAADGVEEARSGAASDGGIRASAGGDDDSTSRTAGLGGAFATTMASGGARHVLGSKLMLGARVDGEADGRSHARSQGDDDEGDDEDGVFFEPFRSGTLAPVTVTARVPDMGTLNAWVDFNADGDWNDAGEQIFVDQAVSDGENRFLVSTPTAAVGGPTLARFRLTSVAGYSHHGLAPDGEVEDYQILVLASDGAENALGATLDRQPASFHDEQPYWPPAAITPPPSRNGDRDNRATRIDRVIHRSLAFISVH